ncbi:MAG: CHAT domain-containing protein [Acidobacteria bacterium]|nr:CHAT domain-containing protein [Acidobacteriota bacterium]MBI3421735.1 CHAT domain-containing protein [Acidobacteriota bacterium]
MGNELNQSIPDRNDHFVAQDFAACLSGALLPERLPSLQDHLIRCADCREQLAMIRQSTQQPDAELEGSPEFDGLLRLGEAAALAAKRGTAAQPQLVTQIAEPLNWRHWFVFRQPAFGWAVAAALLLVFVVPTYFYYQRNQPVELAMASLRQAWTQSRPLEARVTGGFPYLPYQVTRGGNDAAPVKPELLLAATAELAREVADRPSPKARQALGRLHLLKREFDQAEQQLRAVLEADPQNPLAYVDLATLLYERGTLEQSVLTFSQAAENCEQALKLAPRLPEAWFNLALIREQMMLPSEAKSAWEKYLEIDSTSRWADEARTRLQKLRTQSSLPKTSQDLKAQLFLVANDANNDTEIRRLWAEHFSELSELLTRDLPDEYLAVVSSDNRAKADQYRRVLLRLAQSIKETKDEHFFADLFTYIFSANKRQLEKIKNTRLLLAQAETNFQTGHYDQAISLYTKARGSAEQAADVCHSELALSGLALMLNSQQVEPPQMPQLRQRLIAETSRHRHQMLHARALIADTNLRLARQDFYSALQASLQAYEIFSRLGDTGATANALRFVGSTYADLGDRETGINKNLASLQLIWGHSLPTRRACQVYTKIAELLAVGGNLQPALDYQLEASRYCQSDANQIITIASLAKTGTYYAQAGRNEEAIRPLNEAISLAENYQDKTGNAILTPDLYLNLGNAFLNQQRWEVAEAAYRKVLSIVGEHNFYNQSVLHHRMAIVYLRQGKDELAEKELHDSIELIERARKNTGEAAIRGSFLNDKSNVYRTMVGYQYFRKKTFDRAFDYAEMTRGSELRDALTGIGVKPSNQSGEALESSGFSTALTLKQVQQSIPANAQLVTYAVTDERLLIWVVTAQQWMTVAVPITEKKLQSIVSDYLAQLYNRGDIDRLNSAASKLYEVLIEPIAHRLDGQSILIIVPDRFLNAVPFSALVSPNSQRYLVQDYATVINPSASVAIKMLELGRLKKGPKEALLTVSNPRFNPKLYPALKPLPRTAVEVTAIRSLYSDNTGLTQAEATKSALLKLIGDYEIVHLATHSIVNEQNPLRSLIILATEKADADGNAQDWASDSLQAGEIFKLKLQRTRLVVLSSCRAAANTFLHDQGMGGLAHSFFSAGVPNVIAGLWEVDDDGSVELMNEFHRVHRIEKRSFSTALQQAQLKMLNSENQQWRHPYYWAAFVISGNGVN